MKIEIDYELLKKIDTVLREKLLESGREIISQIEKIDKNLLKLEVGKKYITNSENIIIILDKLSTNLVGEFNYFGTYELYIKGIHGAKFIDFSSNSIPIKLYSEFGKDSNNGEDEDKDDIKSEYMDD